jgi:putative AbiEii toxin of type IV toxin-antitoxin system
VYVPKIHRVRIENFRRIRGPLELDFTSPRGRPSKNVVLAGPNACGKTSALEAILLGLGQEHLIVRDAEGALRKDKWRTTLPQGARIELDVSFDGGSVLKLTRTHNHQPFTLDLATGVMNPYPPFPPRDVAVEYFSSWRTPDLLGPVKPLAGRAGRSTETETKRLSRLKQKINDERARGGYVPARAGQGKADRWLERINQAWRRFHGDDDETTIDAQIVDPDAEELFADLFVLRGGRRVCSVDEVSAGEIELLSFAGWLITNDFKGGLLVVDEPELHLHPRWQSTFLPALHDLAPDAQFIVASHADAVWEQAHGFERFLLAPAEGPRSNA